jgi:hypothetical protein
MGRIEKYAELPCFSFDGSLARILAIESGSIAFLGAFSGAQMAYPLISYGRFAYSEERRGSSDMARSLRPSREFLDESQ